MNSAKLAFANKYFSQESFSFAHLVLNLCFEVMGILPLATEK